MDGHFLRYILSFKENYFGSTQSLIHSSDFTKNGYRNLISLNRKLEYYDSVGFPLFSLLSIRFRKTSLTHPTCMLFSKLKELLSSYLIVTFLKTIKEDLF
jgi:hypothetical protein